MSIWEKGVPSKEDKKFKCLKKEYGWSPESKGKTGDVAGQVAKVSRA